MAGFGTEVVAVLRAVHITAAVVWLGMVYFMTWVRPRILDGMSTEMQMHFMPHLARRIRPWIAWGASLTLGAGALLYVDQGLVVGWGEIGWGLNLGAALGLVMGALGLGVVYPTVGKIAGVLDGDAPPAPQELARMGKVASVVAWLSFVVLALMILPPRMPDVFG